MKSRLGFARVAGSAFAVLFVGCPNPPPPSHPAADARPSLTEVIRFEPNRGQASEAAEFIGWARGYQVFLRGGEVRVAFFGPSPGAAESSRPPEVRVSLEDAQPAARGAGEAALGGRASYLLGNDPGARLTRNDIQNNSDFGLIVAASEDAQLRHNAVHHNLDQGIFLSAGSGTVGFVDNGVCGNGGDDLEVASGLSLSPLSGNTCDETEYTTYCDRPCPTCDNGAWDREPIDATMDLAESGYDCGGPCPVQDCCTNDVQDSNEGGIDCGAASTADFGCPASCVDCLAPVPIDHTKLIADSANVPIVMQAANDVVSDFAGPDGPRPDLDEDDVRGSSDVLMEAVAWWVEARMHYQRDGFLEFMALADQTLLGTAGTCTSTTEPYCGDCEDFAVLRLALLRYLGVNPACVSVANHYSTLLGNAWEDHTFNLVLYEGKWRQMDRYSLEDRLAEFSKQRGRVHNVWNDQEGGNWRIDPWPELEPETRAANYWNSSNPLSGAPICPPGRIQSVGAPPTSGLFTPFMLTYMNGPLSQDDAQDLSDYYDQRYGNTEVCPKVMVYDPYSGVETEEWVCPFCQ